MRPWIFLLLFCLLLPLCVTAQQWGFESLGAERGLPASEAYNMFQDDKGYIFIATEYGMVKYNGNRFVPVCTNIPLRERIAYAFCKRSNGEYCFINSQFHFYTIRNDSAFTLRISGKSIPLFPHGSPVKQIFIDSLNNVYSCSPDANFFYKPANGKWIVFDRWDTLKNNVHLKIAATITKVDGNFFRSTTGLNSDHIMISNTAYAGIYKLPALLKERKRYYVRESDRGLYLLWNKELVQITRGKKISTYTAPSEALTMNFSADGHVWLGLHNMGLMELDSNLRPLHHYLDRLSIADILFDRQQGVWLTSLEQGVFHCKNIYEYRYDHIEGCAGEIRFMKIINDKLFAGTVNGQLLVIGPEGNRVVTLGRYNVQDAIQWQQGYLIAAKNCIFSLDSAFRSSAPQQHTSSYLLLAQGKNLLNVGPSTLSLFSPRRTLKQDLFLPTKITCIMPLGGDSLLAGCTKGIFMISNNQFSIPPDLYPLRNCNISDMKQSRDGALWIGTKGDGLLRLGPDKVLKKIPTPSGIITRISFFKDSTILLSTNIGLYAWHYRSGTPEWSNLYDGEITNALPYQNKIFIGTKHGLVSYDTAALFKQSVFPVYLSSVLANGRSVNLHDIQIGPGEPDLTFSLDMLSYNRPATPLRYRLNGPLYSEGPIAGTQLFLQNLKPGHYSLHIYIGPEAKQPALIVPFYIRPAFWQTNIFLAGCIGAGLFLLLAGAYLLYRRARSITNKKAAIQRMLSEYKLTALKAQINPHFMSNSLAAIQQLMLSNEVDKAGRYLALFSLLIRHVLQYSDKSLVSLADELKIVELNVSLEQLRFSDQFIFETELAPDIDPLTLSIPPLITQPFIENAIWHGLLPLRGQRRPYLLIKVRREQDQVIISVIDNGVGRKTNQEQHHYRNAAFASRGLGLTQSRIENLNQLYPGEQARMEITDLYDGPLPAGTQIDIILPYIPNTATYGNPYPESYHRR